MGLLGKTNRSGFVLLAATTCLLGLNYVAVRAEKIPNSAAVAPEFEFVSPAQDSAITPENQPWRKVRLVHSLKQAKTVVDSLVFSPDSKILVSGGGSNNPQMHLWSVEQGSSLAKIRAQRTAILAMAISPDGKSLISGGKDSALNVWDWQTGKYQAALLEHSKSVTSLAISPDSQVLVSGGLDGIKVWDLTTSPQRPLYTLVGKDNLINIVAIHPNGYIVASGDDRGKVAFWNLRTGTKISDFSPHTDLISGLAFSPDGDTLITASHDRQIKIWNLGSGELQQTLTGHSDAVRAIALNPQGGILASGGNDGILIWDLASGKLLHQLNDHRNWVQSLAFSPDGNYLASGGYDFTVKVWSDSLLISNEQ
jgi:COMPASS component SWD3